MRAGATRRAFLGGAAALSLAGSGPHAARRPLGAPRGRPEGPILVGSANAEGALAAAWARLKEGVHPLDCALDVVQEVEKDPRDMSVGYGGLPNERGVVQLDAACMDGATHNSGAVACIENIMHPSRVAKRVMERTDHCLLVGRGAYEFALLHGEQHTELLTPKAREIWLRWKENLSGRDDYLPERTEGETETGWLRLREDMRRAGLEVDEAGAIPRIYGTIHCSALSAEGQVACTTTTSGLSFKIPGRVGDSPIVGAGLYCDAEVGSAGATGRGEAAVLANGSFAIVELMRQGAEPEEAGLEVLRRVTEQAQRQAAWQPDLLDENGVPAFGLNFYVLRIDGAYAGVTLRGGGGFAVVGPEKGPRIEPLVPLHR